MAGNIEYQLICKILQLQDFHTVEKLKIDEGFFLGDQYTQSLTRDAFRFIRDHYHNTVTYGYVPSWELFSSRFYGFPWTGSYDSLPTLCNELRRAKVRAQMLTLTEEIQAQVEADPFVALNTLREAASTFSSQHEITSDLLLSSAHERLYQEYEMIQNGHGIIGIPFPWDILNEDTQGMQKEQFIIIYGRPKSMKTWIALHIACNAYMHGARVLIYSLEMSEIMVLRRCAALLAQVEYSKFKNAKLDPQTHAHIFGILQHLKAQEQSKSNNVGHQPALLATKPGGEGGGISSLHAKIREFQPDLVVVDGMYLMKDDRSKQRTIDWKAVAHVSQDLKRTAQQFAVPVIGVTQANRGTSKDPKQANLDELSYADSLGQDCDLCMRVFKQKDTASHEDELVMSFPGSRESKLEAFVTHGIPAVNFHFKRATVTDPNNPNPPQQQGNSSGSGGQRGGGGGGGRGGAPTVPTNWRTT